MYSPRTMESVQSTLPETRLPMRSLFLAALLIAAMASIVLSAEFASNFPLRAGPGPEAYPLGAQIAFVAAGLLCAAWIAIDPDVCVPILFGTAILAAGTFVLGFPIFDEWLVGCVAVGAMVAVARGSVPLRMDSSRRAWMYTFRALMLYLLIECFVGFVSYHNVKIVRFAALFGAILVVSVLLWRYRFRGLNAGRLSILVAGIGTAYGALYLAHGFVFMKVTRIGDMEGIGGAGAAYSHFASIVVVPAAILLMRDPQGWARLLGWVALMLSAAVALITQSRAGVATILVFAAVAPFAVGVRTAAKAWGALVLTGLVVGASFGLRFEYIGHQAEAMAEVVQVQEGSMVSDYRGQTVVIAKGDTQRQMLNQGAIATLAAEPLRAVFGVGIYGYWPIAGPYVNEVRRAHGVPGDLHRAAGGNEPPRPPALPAFIVELGVVGVLLFAANALLALDRAFKSIRTTGVQHWRPMLLVVVPLLMLALWAIFVEIQDIVVAYLLLMPYGLIDSWSSETEVTA